VEPFSLRDFETKQFTATELTDQGAVSAIISTFQLDRDGDVMTRDAFTASEGKEIPMVWSHNWDQPVGKGTVRVNDTGAEYHGQFFLDTQAGQEAYKTVKAMGSLQEYSIGFRILDATRDVHDGEPVRTIRDIELFEASPVLVGAAYGTRTLAVKSSDRCATDEGARASLDIADAVLEMCSAVLKAGRVLSQPNLDRLHSVMQDIGVMHDGTCDMGDTCPMQKAAEPAEIKVEALEEDMERDRRRADLERALSTVRI